jgi:hypothetical protein
MAKDPGKRYQSMLALAEALEAFVDNRAPSTPTPARSPVPSLPRKAWLIVTGAGVLALLIVLAVIVPWKSRPALVPSAPQPAPQPAADLVQPGSRWEGPSEFRPPIRQRGTVWLKVSRREGSAFSGTYGTEEGDYEWEIKGKVEGDRINWGFTKVIREKLAMRIVGSAEVKGTIQGKKMILVYKDNQPSTADVELRLQK